MLIRLLAVLLFSSQALAAVLPEDRIDVLYHGYDGGGAEITGPSVLVRKQFADTVSISANYYVDMVSSASIDVETTASAYTEERTQSSVGIDYLNGKTTMSLGVTTSKENDYDAKTYGFGISQDFFGDLSTISLGVSFGDDIVRRNGDEEFEDEAKRTRYNVSLSQVITKDMIASAMIETVIDEGFLNNPYRSVRYCITGTAEACETAGNESELYPRTRNSDAFAIRAKYFLPYRAAVKVEARVYQDSWGIEANNWELKYVHPIGDQWLVEAKYRQYNQTKGASFYSDLFDFQEATNFRARDKELSEYTNSNIGLGVTYEVKAGWLSWFDRTTANFYWDYMMLDYDTFKDARMSDARFTDSPVAPGQEDAYSLDASVVRFFVSFWY
ncbi:DUF3570 domain-containing protein [Simiduia curdlanivorans]|uniref:DUF3570 domain-containing protein n=1 Tax=Simiduia curdlanivorans TaxID=1492769 RepID=A0ABV8V1V8_9GAMM|nr:DUF3570 domain-containing protein [Simiduia curdlanivorans]MDN3638038.1 DUF3570 domain-containing protein [Simiduia curdlanivorans]